MGLSPSASTYAALEKCDRLEQHETKNLSGYIPFDGEG